MDFSKTMNDAIAIELGDFDIQKISLEKENFSLKLSTDVLFKNKHVYRTVKGKDFYSMLKTLKKKLREATFGQKLTKKLERINYDCLGE